MSNYNLKIALTKLKGAKVMEIQGKTCTKTCVVIPIDNEEGTVRDSYEGKIDGVTPTTKFLEDVQLNLTAFEFREKKYGQTHGLKASFSRKRMESMSEEELRSMPFIGNMKPWNNAVEDDDLPAANGKEDW
jgi:hypothetical protein